MAYKNIPNEVKVEALKEALILRDVKEIALKYNISEETIKNCYNKVLIGIDGLIKNEKPGPKTLKAPKTAPKIKIKKVAKGKIINANFRNEAETIVCTNCGSTHVVKNGTYPVINWLYRMILLLMPFLHLDDNKRIQKYICKNCTCSLGGIDRHKNTYLRNTIKLQIGRLIALLRFKHGLSIRSIADIIKSTYGVNCSVGYVTEISTKISNNAKVKLDTINNIEQTPAKMMIFDETFPKSKETSTMNLGVIVDENGLIRKVKSIVNKKDDITTMFKLTITKKYNPIYFLSDYDNLYPVIIKKLIKNIIEMKDFVHTIRQLFRDCKTAINRVKVGGISNLSLKKQKEITDLKKKLLRKRVNKILFKLIKGFKKNHAEVGTIYIEGALEELKVLAQTFPSLNGFYKKVDKFIKKNIGLWAVQMELSVKENITTTSNIIESKNSIFKAFSKKAKCFENIKSTENFFSAVALMENFDIKSRGKNKGTSAITRSGLNLSEFGATDFFEAVNINKVVFSNEQSCENVFIKELNIDLTNLG